MRGCVDEPRFVSVSRHAGLLRKSESLATSMMIGMLSELRAISACQIEAATIDRSGELRQLCTIRVGWCSLIVQKLRLLLLWLTTGGVIWGI